MRHDSFTMSRVLAAAPDRVWRAWSDKDRKAAWFAKDDAPGWRTVRYDLDFRIGGAESGAWAKDGLEHSNATTFLDIEDGARIVYAYTMALDDVVHSASLATVTFAAEGDGTRLTFTEQGVYYGDSDGIAGREAGWEHLMGALARSLEAEHV
ncbi:SRPBCC family protein [Pontivivens ytuae]|uniref:SRPBCC family protein n=1 Tax=Pontivivens ytuae TaxID=2789856 RepID=A0A7S9LPK8_9RHOB|nr:SRPBCC family protein [Pontivivens ytuae]QPH52967.1 SRPBCC family protein [Pontivivens ytuae]